MLSVITSLDWFIIKKGPEDRGRGEVVAVAAALTLIHKKWKWRWLKKGSVREFTQWNKALVVNVNEAAIEAKLKQQCRDLC